MNIILNSTSYTVTNKQLPWAGKIEEVNTTAKLENNELVFNVVCNNKSPERGRVYCVVAVANRSNRLKVLGYFC